MATIGFVGLGHMGLPMALNLVKAGHHVIGFDLQTTATLAFEQGGGANYSIFGRSSPSCHNHDNDVADRGTSQKSMFGTRWAVR